MFNCNVCLSNSKCRVKMRKQTNRTVYVTASPLPLIQYVFCTVLPLGRERLVNVNVSRDCNTIHPALQQRPLHNLLSTSALDSGFWKYNGGSFRSHVPTVNGSRRTLCKVANTTVIYRNPKHVQLTHKAPLCTLCPR